MSHSRSFLFVCAGLLFGLSPCGKAAEGPIPQGIAALDHVWVIMMENHGYQQILNNPRAPFINALAKTAHVAQRYYAVGHPSLTNYLELVGGSNFGIKSDRYPDWHNRDCTPNIVTGQMAIEQGQPAPICPISGTGVDAATAVTQPDPDAPLGAPNAINIDGVMSLAAAPHTLGLSIADQLVRAGLSWKSYQEGLPLAGADRVNYSDGVYTDSSDFKTLNSQNTHLALSQRDVVALYAVKHNPFAYFRSVQEGQQAGHGLSNSVGFDGDQGLYADLATGHTPTFSFIAPNQCNDQHGRNNAGAMCNYDVASDGSQASLNPALLYRGDTTVQRLVTAITRSPAWPHGRNALVLLWDENDFSHAPNTNQVLLLVLLNEAVSPRRSAQVYTHFSVLKTLEAGFHLPCLNHACDANVPVMADIFGAPVIAKDHPAPHSAHRHCTAGVTG